MAGWSKMVQSRYFIAFFALLVILSGSAVSVSAELGVKSDKGSYNLGDAISVDYAFSRDQDFSGLVKLSLVCSDFGLEFYTLPTNIFAGQGQQVTVPPLAVSQSMLGRCYVFANATSYDGSINESGTSNFFNVTRSISVSVRTDKEVYLPSERVEVSGEAAKSHFLPASVVMAFLGNNYAVQLANNSFAYSIKLPKKIRSGRHLLEFAVNDSYGNSGSASLEFGVEAVPTSLVNTLSAQSVRPGEEFVVSAVVYDQADDRMQSDVAVSVNDSSGSIVLSASGSTSSGIALAFPQGQEPGAYTLTSSALGLAAYSQLFVEEVENVSVIFDNEIVVLKNTGNVNYARQFNVELSGKRSYAILNDVDLAPGETFEVDLSHAVSSDNYSIGFPTLANATSAGSVYVNDERSAIKKVFDYFRITGRNVQIINTGTGKFQARFAPVLLLVIVAVLAFYLVRNRAKGSASSGRPKAEEGSRESGPYKPASQAEARNADAEEEARIRRIIEEKRRLQMQREPAKETSLRDDPRAKKFVHDMMKDKPFR